ncbi:hypothetical protein DEIGR_100852 [Deinococcus grandis]|uniref:Uncharacterized protein n=1 Tax=Deinococcus grandis TaxID=57498 RepID=A0A100HK03_9DEIO|nr:hypothetical protein [Deinococcus grandis]BBN95689.1 hypothetical protein DEGR_24220 [Deinococcus grandis]GAQ20825.1 hypothetical protein DEIGR_100852 [Deinococcus grandis]
MTLSLSAAVFFGSSLPIWFAVAWDATQRLPLWARIAILLLPLLPVPWIRVEMPTTIY